LVEALPGAIVTSTPDGGLRYVSPQLQMMLGYSQHQLTGGWTSLVERFIHPDDQQPFLAAMMESVSSGNRLTFEARVTTASDEIVWVNFDSILVDDGSPDAPVWQTLVFDVTERHSLTEQLTHQAFHDALTGLPNRLLFDDRVGHALERSQRELGMTAVCFVDLDNFKIVNDSLGHKYGDLLVVEVGQRLRSCLRQGDTVARLGGDEFALLLEGQDDRAETIAIAERILEHLSEPYDIDGQPVYTSASIGIAYAGRNEMTGAELIRHADVAMYEAKRRGKSRYEVFEPHMEVYARQRLDLEVELRDALARQEFRVFYQPIVNLSTGSIDEVEALIRWQHPTRGLLGPAEFLPTAEETGLIVPIGDWLLNEACCQIRQWHRLDSYQRLMLSVNLSPRQLHDPNLAADISTALAASGLEPRMLQLEVAESAMLADVEQATQAIRQLTALGVRIAIDDFGTGNSSLGHLRQLPVNTLKIDRSYVMELGKSDQGTTMLRAMVTLGKTLGMDVTAEGIETIEQTSLRNFGCDFGQGYYFARPLTKADMNALLHDRQPFEMHDSTRIAVVQPITAPAALAAG
jgi:diguanylate cyclase (GGDEF)-like protein/PAS domain S-box-containing protein